MEFIFGDIINNPKIPKWLRYLLTVVVCGAVLAVAVILIVESENVIATIILVLVAAFAAFSLVYLCVRISKSHNYVFVRLIDKPDVKQKAAEWFHEKWGIPSQAYLESMDECLANKSAVPQWYVAIEAKTDRIIAGIGVIANDFHDRKDLTPNVCAVFVEPDRRKQGIAGDMLDFVCRDMKKRGISTLYLVTDHVGFYERYGWQFLCLVQGDGEEGLTRMYVRES